jgi:hypothetical protein
MKKQPNQPNEIEPLTESELDQVLFEFLSTNYFRAVIQYLDSQLIPINTTLKALDPFRQPTDIARSQGYAQCIDGFKVKLAILAKKVSETEGGS